MSDSSSNSPVAPSDIPARDSSESPRIRHKSDLLPALTSYPDTDPWDFAEQIRDEQVELVSADRSIVLQAAGYRAVIDRVGASVQGLWATSPHGVEVALVEPYGKECPFCCGRTLVPWPNRVEDAHFTFRDTLVTLEMTEPALNNAIHGIATTELWDVTERAADNSSVTLEYRHAPSGDKEWPWEFSTTVRYSLSDKGLTVSIGATNRSRSAMPWGYGAHPYLTVGGAPLDTCTLWAAVSHALATDNRNLPTGDEIPLGEQDLPRLNETSSLADVWLDTPFSLAADRPVSEGWCELSRLSGTVPATGDEMSVIVEAEEDFSWLQIFTTGERTVSFPGRDRALAVEPMTCPPNALVSAQDIIVINPQCSWSAQWRIKAEHGE